MATQVAATENDTSIEIAEEKSRNNKMFDFDHKQSRNHERQMIFASPKRNNIAISEQKAQPILKFSDDQNSKRDNKDYSS